MNKNKISVIFSIIKIFLFIFLFNSPLFASPFSDIPREHWSYDAVQMLEEKGLIEGYPDGFFKGDRPVTRYEMAMVVAGIVARLEQIESSLPGIPDLSPYATKEDMELINKLLEEFKGELTALGVRVNNIEDSLEAIDLRIKEEERITLSGSYVSVFHSMGFSPGERNINGPGNANPNPLTQPPNGPSVIPGKDLYIGGAPLFQGSALVSKLELTIKAKLTESVKAGATFSAYSAFGDKGVADWTLIPAYNPLGNNYRGDNFQGNLSTLWFDSDGDWDIKGEIGEYRLNNVSSTLFLGPRNIYKYDSYRTLPMNGINFSGTLYKKLKIEAFMARNINSYMDFNYPADIPVPGRNPDLYYFGVPRYTQVNRSWYPLATPYNSGAGAIHQFAYNDISPGQYDNFLYGLWTGYDFSGGKAHIECAYLKLFENYASNPDVLSVGFGPKLSHYYGFKGHYSFKEDKIRIYGEFNRTRFDYNLLDRENKNHTGNLFELRIKADFSPFIINGRFISVDANYDPFGYHKQIDLDFLDDHSVDFCRNWKLGSLTNGLRWEAYLPNRIGFKVGLDWYFGEKKEGQIFTDFLYQKQLHPTMITDDENSFQKYDFMTGLSVAGTIGANIFGNQDTEFTVNDPAKGRQFFFKIGGKYSSGKFHTWARYSMFNFKRDFLERVNPQGESYNQDLTYSFIYTGVTYDLTDKFSLQGNFAFSKIGGIHELGLEQDRTEFIPGAGMSYSFNKTTDFVLDYKFYHTTDSTTEGTNDYDFQRVVGRFVVRF